jgi:tetratricopeptide (TPR) repeat protein
MEAKDLTASRTAIATLEQIAASLTQTREMYWAEQVKIQHLGASAWLALAEGRKDQALSLMREAADREDKIEKNAVTPGPLAPAREQLGEMLLALNQPEAALAAFETTLKKEANRFRALAGAVAAERRLKKGTGSGSHADAFLKLTANPDGPVRPEVAALKAGAGQ